MMRTLTVPMAALALAAQHAIELPVAEQVVAVIAGERSVRDAMSALFARDLRAEA